MSVKYSVIIPVYNAAGTLRRCLDSLICQTRSRAELIVINDGSKDESLSICREYEGKYPEIKVIDQQNAGASAARNAGLDAAEGTYITFVDSDDYVPENYFELLDQANDADFAIYAYIRIMGKDQFPVDLPQSIRNAEQHEDRVIETVRNCFASPCDKRYKRSIIEGNHIRFKRDLIIGEDFLFGLTYMLCCQTSFSSGESIYFFDESSSMSVTRSSKFPSSQYYRIYEYAFPVAESSGWNKRDYERLLQQIDYLFCRTSFVAAARLQKLEKKDCSLKEMLQSFHKQCRQEIRPLNIKHALMKWCVEKRATPVYMAVSFLHNNIKKLA